MHKVLPFLIVVAIAFLVLSQSLTSEAVLGKKTESDSGKKYLGNSIDKLQEVEAKAKNKDTKNELKTLLEDTVEADQEIDTHISSMEARPSYVKFIMGPDYKNAGEVRSEIVHLQNDIRKLDKLEEKSGASGSGTFTETKATLQAELAAIETKIYDSLQGFSLLGWLNKLLTGFVPTASPSPVPSTTPLPSTTPEASASATPFATVEPSPTP